MLKGYKTYIVGIACVVAGVCLMILGDDKERGLELVMLGLGFMGLRAAIPAK